MKIAICDDFPAVAESTTKLLIEYDKSIIETYTFYNPNKLLQKMNSYKFDIFILDIEMNEKSGIDTAKEIRKKDLKAPIIFLTNYRKYMEEVFQVQTFDYIIKPITKDKLYPLLDRLSEYLSESAKKFTFSMNKTFYQIPMNKIIYLEKDRRKVLIYEESETYSSYLSTKEVLDKLSSDFVQIHSSIIINSAYIKEIGRSYVLIEYSGKTIELPISRKFKDSAYEKIIRQIRKKTQ